MMVFFYILVFLISCLLLALSGKWLIKALIRIAKFLHWREFIVAFFIMAFACSIPNLVVGVSSALRKIPELSFGDVVGGNVIDLTLVLGLAVLFANCIPAESRMVQRSAIFTIVIAVLPMLLIIDGSLDRIDGIMLILAFAVYAFWLFSKEERFKKVYDGTPRLPFSKTIKLFLKDFGTIIGGIFLLIIAAQGIITSAKFFADKLSFSPELIGILIVALGNCLPETYFSIISAKKGECWLILGDLMGAVIVPATLVLGTVALICPIQITDFSSLAIARIFLIISAISFLFFLRTGQKITRKEALFLIGLYIIFISVEILKR